MLFLPAHPCLTYVLYFFLPSYWHTKREAVFGYVAQYLQTASYMDVPIMWLHLCFLTCVALGTVPCRRFRCSPSGYCVKTTKNCKGLMIDFSFVPPPFRSVGTQKEKPSLTSRGLSQMASYLVYLTANTQSCLSYDNFRTIVSFDAAKVRILFESTKYFSKFFRGCFDIPYK